MEEYIEEMEKEKENIEGQIDNLKMVEEIKSYQNHIKIIIKTMKEDQSEEQRWWKEEGSEEG